MLILSFFILFVFGIIIGSFLNVVIYRTLHEESPLEGRSKCDHCKKQIAWYDNVPLLSFLLLRAKCRYCKKPISWMNPIVELTTGILFVWWYFGGFLFFQLTQRPFSVLQPFFWLTVAILLMIIFYTDLISYTIPNYAVSGLFILALLYRLALTIAGIMQMQDFVWSLVGACGIGAGFFLLWWGTKGKGMGFGDVKFSVPMGLLLGWPVMVVGTLIAFIAGSLVGIYLIIIGKKTMKQAVPFGPFLVFGTVCGLLYGEQLLHWYLNLL